MEKSVKPSYLPHQIRVIAEWNELQSRFEKLHKFVNGENFSDVDKDEKKRLVRQLAAMRSLLNILDERIEAFGA